MVINGQGKFEITMEQDARITVRSLREFTILVNNEIVAPNNALDRYAQIEVRKGDDLVAEMDEECQHTIIIKELPNRNETPSSESLVEIIPEGEMSMYDRLRGEMMGLISQYAEKKGMDTWEDDGDYEIDDDEDPLIDTPYEFNAMIEEEPIDHEKAQNPSEEIEIEESREEATTENDEQET